MSRAAAGLVKALLAAAADPAHRILLTEIRSVDWQPLTFVGERHELTLRLIGPDACTLAERLVGLLPDREWSIAGTSLPILPQRSWQRTKLNPFRSQSRP